MADTIVKGRITCNTDVMSAPQPNMLKTNVIVAGIDGKVLTLLQGEHDHWIKMVGPEMTKSLLRGRTRNSGG